ncbi:hypothetical protein F441_07651 [Phytophthora nicotianae CJ01A1]|uniref:Uncharacterized protein n=1 Tax=Phytophthora nicotianae CJ01A1 TaxID=1317063 RepID=W2X6E2_PHYNI|nr:hypothetical protein F441_07651 [Phytophthora nicotianae CJ01A1]
MEDIPATARELTAARSGFQDLLTVENEDDDDDLIAQYLQLNELPTQALAAPRGGSYPGKRPNKERDFLNARMSKAMFQRVLDGVLEVDPAYFEHRPDATKKIGIHPIMKATAALRVLAYALTTVCLDENLEMSSTVAYNSVMHFVESNDKRFGAEYLRFQRRRT